ncbi:MAG TPA: dihydrodipicolinate synthase family protein [Candidatus Acidoferrum sp.]|nr:dihydrodipicolinate synthase family protein [Candidatus Acidoferrum sp.]
MNLSGVFPALTTPYSADGAVSVQDIKHNIGKYNATGIAGYVAIGSTGESVLLSPKEVETVLIAVKESAAPGKLLIAGTGAESTAETIERTKRAAELGYHVALVKTPYYYKPVYKPEVLIAHFRRVADASPIPVMLYSVPQFTGIALEAPEVAVLSQHPNIIGIKESSGVVQRTAEMLGAVSSSFQIIVGSASMMFPSIILGAVGAILALGSALPERCVALFEAVRTNNLAKARELQTSMVSASKLIVSQCGIPGVKYAMDEAGFRGGLPRLPLPPLHDDQKQAIRTLMAKMDASQPARLSGAVSV